MDTRGELLVRIMDDDARIRKCEDQLRRTTHDLRTRDAKCSEVDFGIFGKFIVNCNRFVISV